MSLHGYEYLFTCSSTHQVCADLIKEKIEFKPIHLIGFLGIHYDNRNYSVCNSGTDSCCIDLLVCRGADKQTKSEIDTADLFSKEISFTNSNPTAAYGGLWVQSLLYYDVFLITNQRAISVMLTAFFYLHVLANCL